MILNIVLLFNIVSSKESLSPSEKFEEVMNLYESRNIDTEAIELKEYESLGKYAIKVKSENKKIIEQLSSDEYDLKFDEGTYSMQLYDMRTSTPMQYEDFLSIILEHGAFEEIYYLEQEDNNIIILNQVYDDFIFEDGYIHVTLINGAVYYAEVRLLDVTRHTESYNTDVFEMEKAMLSLLNRSEIYDTNKDNKIVNMEMVYKLPSDDSGQFNLIYGEPSPYWRILLSDGSKIFINGLR